MVVHIYMITIGHTLLAHTRTMISGWESSRPKELPPQSLTQPDVNLSIHPAPIDQPTVAPVATLAYPAKIYGILSKKQSESFLFGSISFSI